MRVGLMLFRILPELSVIRPIMLRLTIWAHKFKLFVIPYKLMAHLKKLINHKMASRKIINHQSYKKCCLIRYADPFLHIWCTIKKAATNIHCNCLIITWRQGESNPWPLDCQSNALANWAMPPSLWGCKYILFRLKCQTIAANYFPYCICRYCCPLMLLRGLPMTGLGLIT